MALFSADEGYEKKALKRIISRHRGTLVSGTYVEHEINS